MFVMRQDKLLKAFLMSYLGWWINKDMKRLYNNVMKAHIEPTSPCRAWLL